MITSDKSMMEVNAEPLPSDKKKGYAGMAAKTGFLLIENDRRLIREHAHNLREAIFACSTQPQVECSVAFARYLSYSGLNNDNYWLFLRLVMTNNPWVVDELLQDRTPRLLFSTIRPDGELLDAAFEMLFSRHPDEMYTPALETVLGIIQNAYFDPDDGYRIRKLSIMDINALGKFLIKDEPQDHILNRLLLEILDRIAQVGGYYGEQDKNVISKHAFNVRYAYFDHSRNLVDAIPEPLLVRVPDRTGVHPEDDYADLVSKRRQRKRDNHGRFVKDTVPAPVPQPLPTAEVKPVEIFADTEGEKPAVLSSAKPKPVTKSENGSAKSQSSPSADKGKTPGQRKSPPKKK